MSIQISIHSFAQLLGAWYLQSAHRQSASKKGSLISVTRNSSFLRLHVVWELLSFVICSWVKKKKKKKENVKIQRRQKAEVWLENRAEHCSRGWGC